MNDSMGIAAWPAAFSTKDKWWWCFWLRCVFLVNGSTGSSHTGDHSGFLSTAILVSTSTFYSAKFTFLVLHVIHAMGRIFIGLRIASLDFSGKALCLSALLFWNGVWIKLGGVQLLDTVGTYYKHLLVGIELIPLARQHVFAIQCITVSTNIISIQCTFSNLSFTDFSIGLETS